MQRLDIIELVILASLWGASFLFMRVAAPEFGPIVLIMLRVAVAAAVLLPVYMYRGGALSLLRQHWRALLMLGILNSAIPFTLFAYSTLTLTAGMAAILNSSAPLFTALLAVSLGHERLTRLRWLGLLIGLVGVLILMGGPSALRQMSTRDVLAVTATLGATMFYAIASNYARHALSGVAPLAVATGSQFGAAVVLLPLAIWLWPAVTPTAVSWGAVAALGVACTGIAYVLFFRLIARIGPVRAMSVTFLIPLFGVLWGMIFLHERLSADVVTGGLVILLGTALSTGLIRYPMRQRKG